MSQCLIGVGSFHVRLNSGICHENQGELKIVISTTFLIIKLFFMKKLKFNFIVLAFTIAILGSAFTSPVVQKALKNSSLTVFANVDRNDSNGCESDKTLLFTDEGGDS